MISLFVSIWAVLDSRFELRTDVSFALLAIDIQLGIVAAAFMIAR